MLVNVYWDQGDSFELYSVLQYNLEMSEHDSVYFNSWPDVSISSAKSTRQKLIKVIRTLIKRGVD